MEQINMIISIKPGLSGFAQYATNREEAAYTIIEGEPKKIDTLANDIRKNYPNRSYTHYSYVLSFKEEHLSKDDLFQYYLRFKEMMFKNYDPRELEFLSVIHWDDNKPHIHVYVLNTSMVSGKDLRLYRGYPDFKRVEAIQELINYEEGLASAFDNTHLFRLSKEQKKRDWLEKKGKDTSVVFDDRFEEKLRDYILVSNSFEEFIALIERDYGKVEIQKFDKVATDGLSPIQIFKEYSLVLLDQPLEGTQGYRRYPSKLFDMRWFDLNLPKLKGRLANADLSAITYKNKTRSSEEVYKKIYESTTAAHAKHLGERKVGHDYLNTHLKDMQKALLSNLMNVNISEENREVFSDALSRYFSLATPKELAHFVKTFPYETYSVMDGHVEFVIYGTTIPIYEENIYSFLSSESKHQEVGKEELHFSLLDACGDLRSNKRKAIARNAFEQLFYLRQIKSYKEMETFLAEHGLKLKRVNEDYRKGKYVSFENEKGETFAVYNDVVYGLFSDSSLGYKEKKEKALEEALTKSYINNYAQALCAELLGRGRYIHTLDDYRLKDSPIKDFTLAGENKNNVLYQHFFNNRFEEIEDQHSRVVLRKTVNEARSAYAMADLFYMKGSDRVVLEKGNDVFKARFVERIKEKGYPIHIIDASGKTLYKPTTQDALDIAALVKEAKAASAQLRDMFNIHGALIALHQNTMKSRKDIDAAKALLKEAAPIGKSGFVGLMDTLSITFERVGRDKEKGPYVTFSYKGKKMAVYDESLYNMFKAGGHLSQKDLETSTAAKEAIDELHSPLVPLEARLENSAGGKESVPAAVKTPHLRCNDKKNAIDITHVGDEAAAAKALVDLALFHEWKGILVNDDALAAHVYAIIKKEGLPIPVYNKKGKREGEVSLDEEMPNLPPAAQDLS